MRRRRPDRVGGDYLEIDLPGTSNRDQINHGLSYLAWKPVCRLLAADFAEHGIELARDWLRKPALTAFSKAIEAVREAVRMHYADPSSADWHYLGKTNAYGKALAAKGGPEWYRQSDPVAVTAIHSAIENCTNMASWYPWTTFAHVCDAARAVGLLDQEVDWQLARLKEYLQAEAQSALVAAGPSDQDLPSLYGDPRKLALALIVREDAAKELEEWKAYGKKERTQRDNLKALLQEKTSVEYWVDIHNRCIAVRPTTEGWGREFSWRKMPLRDVMAEVQAEQATSVGRQSRVGTVFSPEDEAQLPSPAQLATLRKLFPDLAAPFEWLWSLYLLENPNLSERYEGVVYPICLYGLRSRHVYGPHESEVPTMQLLEDGMNLLPLKDQQELIVDLAEDLLPLVEDAWPDEYAPRIAVQVMRRFLQGKVTEKRLQDVANDALRLASSAQGHSLTVAKLSADAIGLACMAIHPKLSSAISPWYVVEKSFRVAVEEAEFGDRRVVEQGRLAEHYLHLLRYHLIKPSPKKSPSPQRKR